MKKSRIISLLLAVIVLASCFLFNPPAPDAVASDEIVTATADDFACVKVPSENPTHIALGQYFGTHEKIRIPEEIDGLPVKVIWSSAFAENETIKYIEFPATVEEIPARAFSLCSSLTEFVVSPENAYFTSVDGVLYNKDKTTLIAFPAGRGGEFTVPESVVTIGAYAFENCYNLTDVKMYNNVLAVQQFAFAFCWNLKSIKLSDNLTNLGFKALAYCDNLLEIHLPATLKIIGTQALVGNIDSDSNTVYNFINGLYYVKGTKAETYVKNLHLTPGYTFEEPRSITDIDTNVVLYDTEGALPQTGKVDFKADILPNEDFSPLLPVRYAKMAAYDVSLTVDGKETVLSSDAIVRFNDFSNAIPSATKVYALNNGVLNEKLKAPQAAFAGATFKQDSTFVVIENNDFSLKGDLDGDGIHTIYDARIALCASAGIIANLTADQENAADIDEYPGIQTNDVREILKYAAGIK